VFADVTVIMLVPLIDGIPPVVCFVRATCNSFTAESVKIDWDTLLESFMNAGCAKSIGKLIGLGSDGDARRVKLQLSHMLSGKHGAVGRFFAVLDPSFVLSALVLGSTPQLHFSDPLQ
jgi:hypothetical protein